MKIDIPEESPRPKVEVELTDKQKELAEKAIRDAQMRKKKEFRRG